MLQVAKGLRIEDSLSVQEAFGRKIRRDQISCRMEDYPSWSLPGASEKREN
jgi:hypothetical protein